jgi:hypothetical protein
MKIDRLELFTDEAFYFSMPNFDVWKQHIENIILIEENNSKFNLDTTPEEECNVKASRTAWNSHERYPAINNLCEEIKKILKKFIEEEGYDIPSLHTDECWINWYTKNQHAVPHSHKPFLAVVLFVDVEESSADFLFHSSKNFVLSKIKDNEILRTNTLKKINVKNGTVVFFDGAIPHSVSSNLSDKRRITLAMNLRPQYSLKRDENK